MVRRLLLGLFIGVLVGGLLAAAIVAGLKLKTFDGTGGALLAYAAAVVAGAVAGLVAGKPIWASGAGIEAGLKAFFGALLAAGGMFALRQWGGGWVVDVGTLGGGRPEAIGYLPVVSLPLLGAVLGALFELDNTSDPEKTARRGAAPRARIAPGAGAKRGSDDVDEEAADEDPAGRRAKR